MSDQTVYRYLYADRRSGGRLHFHLRRKGKAYRKKRLHSPITNRRFMEERPDCVERKERIGDWELDTIVSSCRKAAIVTMVDRVSQLVMMTKVERARAYEVGQAIVRRLQSVKAKVHTLTADNGAEFATHRMVAQKLDADFFFARPYKPWQRALNNRPRKTLNYRTPNEIFDADVALGK